METLERHVQVSTKILPYAIPSIISSEKIDENEETFEILAYAFNLAAKDYFKAKNNIENDIAEVENKKSKTKKYYVITGTIIMFSVIAAILLGNTYVALITIIGVIGSIAVYLNLRKLKSRHAELLEMLESLRIDKKITFLSKLYLPIYLMPYREGVMIFDALGRMPSVSFPVYNLLGDELYAAFNEFREKTEAFEQKISDKSILSLEDVKNYDQNIVDTKILEEPIVETMEKIKDLSENIQRNDVTFQVYGPQTSLAESIQRVFRNSLQRIMEDQNFLTVAVKFTLDDAIQTSEFIRGMKTSAIKEDIVAACTNWRQEIVDNAVLNNIKATLKENINNSIKLFDGLEDLFEISVYNYICPQCVDKEIEEFKKINNEDLMQKYKLVNTFTKYLGAASEVFNVLKDEEHLQSYNERLKNIAEEVKLDLPDEIIRGLLNCSTIKPSMNNESFCCQNHGEVLRTNAIKLPSFTSVFAFTASHIFEELQKPVLEMLKNSARDINQLYVSTKSQKFSLIPLEDLMTQLRIKSKELEVAVQEAHEVLSNI